MQPESFIAELKRQSGKPLNSRPLQRLWKESIVDATHLDQSRWTPRSPYRRFEAPDTPTSARALREQSDKRHESQPVSLEDWVKVHRFLRGAMIPSRLRHRLLDEDIDAFLQPRCGHWQVASDKIPNFPERLRKNRPWLNDQEYGWDQSSIAVYIDTRTNLPTGMNADQFETAIQQAIATWNRASIGISISSISTLVGADIVTAWTSPVRDPHGVLSQRILAHADFPSPNTLYTSSPPLPICFNRMALWSHHIDDGIDDVTRYDIESFALHELGHCIGLYHRPKGSIMYEIVDKGQHRTLDEATIQAARQLYLGSVA